jgi:carboxyl-terminal processing protease
MNILSTRMRRFMVVSVLFALLLGLRAAYGFPQPGNYEFNRARLLGYLVSHYLETVHFSHRKIDKDVSKAALGIYLKQLDPQKRLLLKEDVEKLETYSGEEDGESFTTMLKLAGEGASIRDERVRLVERMVKEILSRPFDFTVRDSVETDPKKLDYCVTPEELKKRWTKTLEYQVLTRYLMLREEQTADKSKSVNPNEEKSPRKELLAQAKEKIDKNYESYFSRMLQEKEREHYDSYFSALARAFDPHSDYMPPTNKENFDISMRGSLEGIGATLKEEDGFIKVVGITPGGPASRQGQLKPEDIILRVVEEDKEPVDLTDMSVTDAVRYIRGKKGTGVKLTVRKPDATVVVIPIVRDIVQIEETFVKGFSLKDEESGRKFGYLRIPSFYRDFEKTIDGGTGRNATDDVNAELKRLKAEDVSGIILDLRNNGGGALTDAVSIAGLFIKTGPVVQVKGGRGQIRVLEDDDPDVVYGGPLVVLVNHLSASASEILAGALQDYGRALIIGGEHTHGKGTVQTMIDLNESIPFEKMEKYKTFGALRLTIQKFYRISGESTQYRGVIPDVTLPDLLNHLKIGEKYLDFSLPWDKVGPASYTPWKKCRPDLAAIRAKSSKRVAASEDFREIEAENKRVIENQSDTRKPLNIEEVRRALEEANQLKETKGKYSHGRTILDEGAFSQPLNSAERKKLWVKEVGEDAYVHESVEVLDDMLAADPTCAAGLTERAVSSLHPAR